MSQFQLKKRIQDLQKEICERTRNYLIHTNKNNRKGCVLLTTSSTQTFNQEHNQTASDSNNFYEPFYLNSSGLSPVLDTTPKKIAYSPIQLPVIEKNDERNTTPNGQEIKSLIPIKSSVYPLEYDVQQGPLDTTQMAQSTYSQLNMNAYTGDKDRRLLKREVKKLKSQIEFQQKINSRIKQGLMKSQQQNYQFRLTISLLLKQLQQKKTGQQNLGKDNQQRLIAELVKNIHRIQKKNQQMNQIICKLEQQKYSLSQRIKQLQRDQSSFSYDQSNITNEPKLRQRITRSLYKISNNIPENNNFPASLFEPETEEQIIQILDRVQQFSKTIDNWQRDRQEAIANQKEHFIEFLKRVSKTGDVGTKQKVLEEASKIDNMKHFIKTLSSQQKLANSQHLAQVKMQTDKILNSQ